MTNDIPSATSTALVPVVTDWEAQCRAHDRLFSQVVADNKVSLFDALARAGITTVVVVFDGYGDSGQIESIDAFVGDAAITLPSDPVELTEPDYANMAIKHASLGLRDAIEALAYDVLHERYGNWEDNDGAFGEFTFDVTNRTITLAYNERHMESDYSEHVF